MEATRKEIVAHTIDKQWNLVRRRELNGKSSSRLYGPSIQIGLQMGISSNKNPDCATIEVFINVG